MSRIYKELGACTLNGSATNLLKRHEVSVGHAEANHGGFFYRHLFWEFLWGICAKLWRQQKTKCLSSAVAERSRARTVFARTNNAIVGSNPTEAWMFVCVLCAFFLFLHSLK
jgi:hypothetical protein